MNVKLILLIIIVTVLQVTTQTGKMCE